MGAFGQRRRKTKGLRNAAAVASLLAARVRGFKPAALKPIPDDPWEFVRDYCVTADERALEAGLPELRRFPDKEYLRVLTREWQRCRFLRVEKSRQLMVTWLVAALTLWWVLKHKGQRVGWYCLKHDLAAGHIANRLFGMYQRLEGMQLPSARLVDGELLVFHNGRRNLPTSRVVPMAAESGIKKNDSAAKQMRSETWSRVVKDESAFYPGAAELHYGIMPACGAMVDISSANGKGFFWRLGHEDVTGEPEMPVREALGVGVEAWTLNGFRHLRLHYSADPDKNPATPAGSAWYAVARKRMDARRWAREMEIEHSVPAGEPVYVETDRIIVRPQSYTPALPVGCGMDFGRKCPVALFVQRRPAPAGSLVPVKLHWLAEVFTPDVTVDRFAEAVMERRQSLFPSARFETWADPAGNQEGDKTTDSSIAICESRGITPIYSQPSSVEFGINLFQWLISVGAMEMDPEGCKMLLAAVAGGYSRDEAGKPIGGEKGHPWADFADAARYFVVNQPDLVNAFLKVNPSKTTLPPRLPAFRPGRVAER